GFDAAGGTRTHTSRRTMAFEAIASTSCATAAGETHCRAARRASLKPGLDREILRGRRQEGLTRYRDTSGRTMEEGALSKKFSLLALGVAAAVVAAVAAGYSGSARSATASVSPLPSSSCGPVVYKGSGSPDFIVASDLPLQGAIRHQTVQVSRAELWALANAGWKAGSFKIGYQSCDDSAAQTGGWDTAKCATNAHLYANNRSVIAVLGTFNSGCAKIEVPIGNRAS